MLAATDFVVEPTAIPQLAREAWPMRAAEELRSAMIFRAAARAAREIGEHSWAAALEAVVHDELRRVCVAVGRQLGAPAPRFDLSAARARLVTLPSARRRLLSILLVEAAIGETVSTGLFRAGRRGTKEPLARRALTTIVGDEVRHARLGWGALAALWPTVTGVERATLFSEACWTLATMERDVALPALRRLEQSESFDPRLVEAGVLSPADRVEAFYDAVERQVLPKLAALGLDAERAWAERYEETTRRERDLL